VTWSGRMSWILSKGKGSVFILMESKWSRLRMISIVTVERIIISVTSPDLGDADDILLGVVQAVSSKGSDQADVKLNLLVYYDIVDHIFAVCWNTASSYTWVCSGAIVLLCTKFWTLPSCGFSAGGRCWQYTSLTSLGHSLGRRPRPLAGA
jgi:hypothetical protein